MYLLRHEPPVSQEDDAGNRLKSQNFCKRLVQEPVWYKDCLRNFTGGHTNVCHCSLRKKESPFRAPASHSSARDGLGHLLIAAPPSHHAGQGGALRGTAQKTVVGREALEEPPRRIREDPENRRSALSARCDVGSPWMFLRNPASRMRKQCID